MKKFNLSAVLIIAGFGFVFFVAIILVAALALSREGGFAGWGGDRIAVVYVEGVIFDSKTVNEQLKMYADDSRVKAILIRMDTPGGGVAASQEIADQVKWCAAKRARPSSFRWVRWARRVVTTSRARPTKSMRIRERSPAR